MSELEDRLRNIKEQAEKAKVDFIKMGQLLETAEQSLAVLMDKLHSKFEVETAEQAQGKLRTMQKDLEELVKAAEEKLNEAKGV